MYWSNSFNERLKRPFQYFASLACTIIIYVWSSSSFMALCNSYSYDITLSNKKTDDWINIDLPESLWRELTILTFRLNFYMNFSSIFKKCWCNSLKWDFYCFQYVTLAHNRSSHLNHPKTDWQFKDTSRMSSLSFNIYHNQQNRKLSFFYLFIFLLAHHQPSSKFTHLGSEWKGIEKNK